MSAGSESVNEWVHPVHTAVSMGTLYYQKLDTWPKIKNKTKHIYLF